jgi:LmbE family N-acetylglucosaminyl deacetylase
MLEGRLDTQSLGRPAAILAVGAHADDIEIGCGGTILRLVERHPDAQFTWVVLSATVERAAEAQRSAEQFLDGASSARVIVERFRDGFLPYAGGEVKEFFERLKSEIDPDLILTHTRSDLHQDHRLACDLTWNTFRDHLVLEYEIPKYDGDLGSPNLFVPLDIETVSRKIELVLSCFPSQRSKRWFTEDLFMSTLRLRGMESNSPTRLAEAFFSRKLVIQP